MIRYVCAVILLFVWGPFLFAQDPVQEFSRQDPQYLEDQFYMGVTYNLLLDKPAGITQRNLSYGLMGGFIKDLPINERRNVGFGIGVGYALNSYYTNLYAEQDGNDINYTALTGEVDFKRSKFETHLVEVPLEFRWRNSNAIDYKFWRVYTGIKLGYAFSSRSKFVSDTEKIGFQNGDIRKLQYGLMLNLGYNTWNIHIYYALSKLLDNDVSLDSGPIEVRPLRMGIIFYIL